MRELHDRLQLKHIEYFQTDIAKKLGGDASWLPQTHPLPYLCGQRKIRA